jgi:uncharacterized membrane protein YfcA
MTLFTSLSIAAQYLALGRIPWSYGVMLFVLGIVSSIFGQFFILRYAKRTGRNSLLVFAVCFILIVSVVLLLASGILALENNLKNHTYIGINSLCHH